MGKREVAAGTAMLWCGYALERILCGKGSFPTRLYWYYEEDKAISELFINEQIRDKKYV